MILLILQSKWNWKGGTVRWLSHPYGSLWKGNTTSHHIAMYLVNAYCVCPSPWQQVKWGKFRQLWILSDLSSSSRTNEQAPRKLDNCLWHPPLLTYCLPVLPISRRNTQGPILAHTISLCKIPLSYYSYSYIISEVGDSQRKTMKVHDIHDLPKETKLICMWWGQWPRFRFYDS